MRRRKLLSRGLTSACLTLFLPAFLLPALQTGNVWDYVLAGGVVALILLTPLGCRIFGCDRLSVSLGLGISLLCLLMTRLGVPSLILSQFLFLLISLGALFLFCWLTAHFPDGLSVGIFAGLMGLGCLALPFAGASLPAGLESLGMPFLVLGVSCLLARRFRIAAVALVLAGIALLWFRGNGIGAGLFTLNVQPENTALPALATGRLFGVGIGLGSALNTAPAQLPSPDTVPGALETVLSAALETISGSEPAGRPADVSSFQVFSLLCEQMGGITACGVMVLYAVLMFRGVHIAAAARERFHGLAAMGATALLGLRALAAAAEALGLVSLGGLPFPLLSTGLLPLAADWALMGILSGGWHVHAEDLEEDTRLAMLAR